MGVGKTVYKGEVKTGVFAWFCRSELAREEPEGGAFIQRTRVIVNVHREQARSYRMYCAEINSN
jgi:hypothetical protein